MASKADIELEESFAQKRMSRTTFLRLAACLRPYRRTFALNLALTLLATISQLLGPKFIQIGIDRYLTNFSSAEIAFRGILIISLIYLGNLVVGWGLSVRSEEHTSELQSQSNLVCRLLLEKKKRRITTSR